MKLLLIAVLLAVTQAAPPVQRKTPDNTNSDKASTPPLSANPVTANPDQSSRPAPKPDDAPKTVRVSELPPVSVARDWIDELSIGLTGILVIVGIFGVRAAYKTLQKIENQVAEMKGQRVTMDAQREAMDGQLAMMQAQLTAMVQQTKAAEDAAIATSKSAEATARSVQIVIDKERARVVVEPLPLHLNQNSSIFCVKYRVFNNGPTYAFVAFQRVAAQLTPKGEQLNDDGFVPMQIPASFAPNQMLDDLIAFSLQTFSLTGSDVERIQKEESVVTFRGIVVYKDVFGEKRVTEFAHIWTYSSLPAPPGQERYAYWMPSEDIGKNYQT